MTASSRRKLRAIVLGIFDKRQHNRQYMRLIWRYLSGKSLKDWTAENAMKYGHVYMLLYFIELTIKYKSKILLLDNPNEFITNEFIRKGNLDIIQYLQKNKIYCTSFSANIAAANGHLHIVEYLRTLGINCTSWGADYAAENGHLHIIQDLQEHGIHCTEFGIYLAIRRGHQHILKLYK